MNDVPSGIQVCNKPKVFHARNDDYVIPCEEHAWRIFIYDNDSGSGIAICTSCAKISGGWIKDE